MWHKVTSVIYRPGIMSRGGSIGRPGAYLRGHSVIVNFDLVRYIEPDLSEINSESNPDNLGPTVLLYFGFGNENASDSIRIEAASLPEGINPYD